MPQSEQERYNEIEKVVKIEAYVEEAREDLRYLYRDFKDHEKRDLTDFKEVKEELMSQNMSITELTTNVKELTKVVEKQSANQDKLMKFMYISVGIISFCGCLIPAIWAVATFVLPLIK